MKNLLQLSLVLWVAVLLALPGCSGGTASVPTVTVKPNSSAKKTDDLPPPPPPKDAGVFSGQVVFNGTAPKVGLPAAFNKKDPKCIAQKNNVKDLSLIVDPQSKGVQDVFVYLTKKPKGYVGKPVKTEAVFDQKACTFLPYAMIVRVGQTIKALNSDQTGHNVHTYPTAGNGINSGLGIGQSMTYKYEKATKTPAKVGCDLHAWMEAYQLPLDHEFYALTDKDGRFTIPNLPAGDYQFCIWHSRKGYINRRYKVTIEAKKTTKKKITYTP